MDVIDSVELQKTIARKRWEARPGVLFKRCRYALGLGVYDAAYGPLDGIITPRRLRRVEKGQEDVPPKAWQVFADLLVKEGRVDLVELVMRICPSVELR
jgi:hypothetical protein